MVGLAAQAMLPSALNARPAIIVRLRPYRSDKGPSANMLAANATK
jgi:hypothetical protein